jgi:hypothetical protein
MKTVLLDAEAVLSIAAAELSMPNPNYEKARRDIEMAREMLLDLAEKTSSCGTLSEAKRELALIYLAMPQTQFAATDAEIFSLLSKDRVLQAELEQARRNN